MNVTGKITLFPKEVGEKKIKIFETSLSRKDENGNYVDNYTLRVQFSKDIMPDASKSRFNVDKAYSMEIEGFLTTRGYDDKNGKHRTEPVLFVSKAKTTGSKDVTRKAKVDEPISINGEELPF